ncbi:PLC-like phosphodiesterase [Cryphonectria parasitica EP155]|uniref:PLC-like phosphodiesterase n=1 Tax=Cryphonectria parasitica (strain ATCC 38755 / EP155) TaxID=660469 RepID=A0A9P4Y9D9_CRYP1|nr:PLC-like phosphodiesterase [Cryphonectria parasitica EP155]KAF3769228.1 PLC-like phosphodiesterase [Cryphonectria parasitica EP155]
MATLSIRNITINPLELKTIERYGGSSPKSGGLAKLGRIVTGLFTASANSSRPHPKDGQEPNDRQDVKDIIAGPFETKETGILAPDVGHEVLRLTFQTPGTEYRYVVDCPGPSARSQVMRRLDGAPLELTVVYTVSGAQLTIFSSAALESWMGELRDEYPLSMLSIPGTHNSPTCYVALPSVRCQAVSVREQLDNGVRFLDVRVSVNKDNDDLALVHSVFPISLTGNRYFSDMLKDLYAFLDANPSEALLMSIKREGTGRGSDHHLSQHLFKRYCGGDDARRWFTEPRIPSLGEARGKLVLIRRFNVEDALQHWGLDAAAWPDNCADEPTGSGLMRVQDFYEVSQSTNIEKKIDMARRHLEKACQQTLAEFGISNPASETTPTPFFVNFLSASNFFNASCWPENIAAKVNPSIIEYLCTSHAEHGKGPDQLDVGDAGTGIVVTDWVGQEGDWDLLRCIVGWNARLQLKK